MRAGKLRHSLAIQSASESRDAMGGVTLTYSTYATRWGSVETIEGYEGVVGAGVQSGATHTVRVRYDAALSGTVPRHRIVFGSRTMDIVDVNNTDQRNVELVMTCKEQK